MNLPIQDILIGITEGKKVALTPEQLELVVNRLSSVDDIAAQESKVQPLPFNPAFILKSDLEFTLNGKTTHFRELQFHDVLRIAQVIPQAAFYLFGTSIENLAENMNIMELVSSVFFRALTDGISGNLTKFTEAVLELVSVLLSNDEVQFDINDLLYAKGNEPMKVFNGLYQVNADFFADLPHSLPAPIVQKITSLVGAITRITAPLVSEKSIASEDSMPPKPSAPKDGGTTNGSSTSTKRRSSKPATATKKSKKPASRKS